MSLEGSRRSPVGPPSAVPRVVPMSTFITNVASSAVSSVMACTPPTNAPACAPPNAPTTRLCTARDFDIRCATLRVRFRASPGPNTASRSMKDATNRVPPPSYCIAVACCRLRVACIRPNARTAAALFVYVQRVSRSSCDNPCAISLMSSLRVSQLVPSLCPPPRIALLAELRYAPILPEAGLPIAYTVWPGLFSGLSASSSGCSLLYASSPA